MTQEEEEWWNRPEKPKKPAPTKEELMLQIERMKHAQEGTPKILFLLQFIAIVFIIINIVFMYSNVNHPMALIIAVYMVPSTLIFAHYLVITRQIKLIARGEKR